MLPGQTRSDCSLSESFFVMDALGLALSLSSAAGLRILGAGNSITAPAGATLAIICVIPDIEAGSNFTVNVGEQIYIVSEGESCKFATATTKGMGLETWTWGSTTEGVNIIFLG